MVTRFVTELCLRLYGNQVRFYGNQVAELFRVYVELRMNEQLTAAEQVTAG